MNHLQFVCIADFLMLLSYLITFYSCLIYPLTSWENKIVYYTIQLFFRSYDSAQSGNPRFLHILKELVVQEIDEYYTRKTVVIARYICRRVCLKLRYRCIKDTSDQYKRNKR
jgi:hypothetical protein